MLEHPAADLPLAPGLGIETKGTVLWADELLHQIGDLSPVSHSFPFIPTWTGFGPSAVGSVLGCQTRL